MQDENNNGSGQVIDFLGARRRLIEQHGTDSRGARSKLLEPIRKAVKSPDLVPLFNTFLSRPDNNHDLIMNLIDHHRIDGTAKDVFQALSHIGIEMLSREATEKYTPDNWGEAVQSTRAAVRLAIFAGDWLTAEKMWLQLGERAVGTNGLDKSLQQLVLFELGTLQSIRGETDSAIEFFMLCETLAGNDLEARIKILLALGREYLGAESFKQALSSFEQACDIAGQTGDPRSMAHALTGLGLALEGSGDTEGSLEALRKAFEIAEIAAPESDRVFITRHLARATRKLENMEESAKLLKQALDLTKRTDDLDSGIALLYDLFETCLATRDWGIFFLELMSAQNHIHETEQFHLLGSLLVLSARAHSDRGLLYLALHNLEEASHLFQALEEFERLDEVTSAIKQLRSIIAESKSKDS